MQVYDGDEGSRLPGQRLFDHVDEDQNGAVDWGEFVSLCANIGWNSEVARRLWDESDLNRSGNLNFLEFLHFSSRPDVRPYVKRMEDQLFPPGLEMDGKASQGQVDSDGKKEASVMSKIHANMAENEQSKVKSGGCCFCLKRWTGKLFRNKSTIFWHKTILVEIFEICFVTNSWAGSFTSTPWVGFGYAGVVLLTLLGFGLLWRGLNAQKEYKYILNELELSIKKTRKLDKTLATRLIEQDQILNAASFRFVILEFGVDCFVAVAGLILLRDNFQKGVSLAWKNGVSIIVSACGMLLAISAMHTYWIESNILKQDVNRRRAAMCCFYGSNVVGGSLFVYFFGFSVVLFTTRAGFEPCKPLDSLLFREETPGCFMDTCAYDTELSDLGIRAAKCNVNRNPASDRPVYNGIGQTDTRTNCSASELLGAKGSDEGPADVPQLWVGSLCLDEINELGWATYLFAMVDQCRYVTPDTVKDWKAGTLLKGSCSDGWNVFTNVVSKTKASCDNKNLNGFLMRWDEDKKGYSTSMELYGSNDGLLDAYDNNDPDAAFDDIAWTGCASVQGCFAPHSRYRGKKSVDVTVDLEVGDVLLVRELYTEDCQGDCFFGFKNEENCTQYFKYDKHRTDAFYFLAIFLLPLSVLLMVLVVPIFGFLNSICCVDNRRTQVDLVKQLSSRVLDATMIKRAKGKKTDSENSNVALVKLGTKGTDRGTTQKATRASQQQHRQHQQHHPQQQQQQYQQPQQYQQHHPQQQQQQAASGFVSMQTIATGPPGTTVMVNTPKGVMGVVVPAGTAQGTLFTFQVRK